MHRLKIIAGILSFSLSCSAQQELLQQYLEVQHQRLHFNGVVLVTQHNKALYEAAIGKASQELDVSMGSGAVFKVASISKQFTAMLVLQAVQEGKLRLNDSLATLFPVLKDTQWRRITIDQLLSHTAGIPHNEGISGYWESKSVQSLSNKQALAAIFSMKLLFQPGTAMKYSSPGYFLLASILETVYQRPYAALLEEKIGRPLQMSNTGEYSTGKIVPGMVPGYHLLNDTLITAPYRDFSLMKGSGDLYATAADLTKWNNSFSSDKTWSKELQQLLFTPHTNGTPAYGYGWFIRAGKRLAYYHGGGTFGCSALSAWYPHEKVSVVILSNVSVLPVNELWNDIEKIVFKEAFQLPEVNRAIQLSRTQLEAFTGRYTSGDQELTITLSADQLYAKLGANPPFEIYPESSNKFYGKKVNVRLTFNLDGEGNSTGLEAEARGQTYHFNKQ